MTPESKLLVAWATSSWTLLGTSCGEAPTALPVPETEVAPVLPEVDNLVVVSLDTTRADHLGLYGYLRETSPTLDAFAGEAVVFEQAWSPMATTLPTHVSLFTAAYPLEHGVLSNIKHGGQVFEAQDGLPYLPAHCQQAGLATGAFVSATPLKATSGLPVGFDVFDEPKDELFQRPGVETTDNALSWLETTTGPFLLWVHLFDAHWPHDPESPAPTFGTDSEYLTWLDERQVSPVARRGPDDYDTREATNAYDAELWEQDLQVGRLVAALRSRADWERTAVVVVGDHGEGLGQHGEAAHGGVWAEQLRVPLVMRVPGWEARRESRALSVVDVLPTLLGGLANGGPCGTFTSASGIDVLREGEGPRMLIAQDTGRRAAAEDYRYSLRTDQWSLLWTPQASGKKGELFDLKADPFELADVADQHPDVVAELAGHLETALESQRALAASLGTEGGNDRDLSNGVAEQLEALGYVDE